MSSTALQSPTVQTLLPDLRLSGRSELPDEFKQGRVSFGAPTSDSTRTQLTGIDRIYNMHTALGANPTVISGREGIGKSVLCWQLMSKAQAEGKAVMMISAATLVMQRDIELPAGSVVRPAHSTFETLKRTLDTLENPRNSSLARNVLLVIDGVDAGYGGYNPGQQHFGARGMLARIHHLGISVIMNVDSSTAELQSPVLSSYYRALNPDGLATLGIKLTSDLSGERRFTRHDVTHEWSQHGQNLNELRQPTARGGRNF